MPTYDYKCTACSHTFEHMQSMKDKPLRKCPKCAKNALERLIGTGGAIIFKGGGFYQTDYRSDSYKKAAEADTKPAEAATATPSAKASKADANGDPTSKPTTSTKADAASDSRPNKSAPKADSPKQAKSKPDK